MPFPSVENQWQPGQSGNPSGRPRRRPITDRLLEQLEETSLEDLKSALGGIKAPEGKKIGDLVSAALIVAALGGDTAALRLLTVLVEGLPRKAGGDNAEPGARAALRAEALEMTRARRADRGGGNAGDPGQPAG